MEESPFTLVPPGAVRQICPQNMHVGVEGDEGEALVHTVGAGVDKACCEGTDLCPSTDYGEGTEPLALCDFVVTGYGDDISIRPTCGL